MTFETQTKPLIHGLRSAALRATKDKDDAEDLLQETLVRAFRFWGNFKQGTNLKAWMFTILRNTYINGYHKARRRLVFETAVAAEVRTIGPAVSVGYSTANPPGPTEGAEAIGSKAKIQRALEALPDDYRQAVELADLDGLSYKEIADIIGRPIGTVMSRIYRGRKLLYKLLYDHARELGFVDDVEPLATGRPSTRGSTRARDREAGQP